MDRIIAEVWPHVTCRPQGGRTSGWKRSGGRVVLEAVRHELQRRRREELKRSLRSPHPESEQLAEQGFDDWAGSLPVEDVADLVDLTAGTSVRWVPGEGWVEPRR
jgi:hypothetical protein